MTKIKFQTWYDRGCGNMQVDANDDKAGHDHTLSVSLTNRKTLIG